MYIYCTYIFVIIQFNSIYTIQQKQYMIKGYDNINPKDFFVFIEDSITRGHRFKVAKQHTRTMHIKIFFSYYTIEKWNSLPSEIVSSLTINDFKSKLENTSILTLQVIKSSAAPKV